MTDAPVVDTSVPIDLERGSLLAAATGPREEGIERRGLPLLPDRAFESASGSRRRKHPRLTSFRTGKALPYSADAFASLASAFRAMWSR